jgi:hypothetical protein
MAKRPLTLTNMATPASRPLTYSPYPEIESQELRK